MSIVNFLGSAPNEDVPNRIIGYYVTRRNNGVNAGQITVYLTLDLRRKVRELAYEMKTNMSRAILRAVAST